MDSYHNYEITNGRIADIDEVANLFYETEIHPDEEWGSGTKDEHIKRLKSLMLEEGNRFSYDNFRILRGRDEIIGFYLAIPGRELAIKTLKSDLKLLNLFKKSFIDRTKFFFAIALYLFEGECLFNEYYLSNIFIKKEYRGLRYSNILLEEVINRAMEKNYKSISLRANNKGLIKFYNKNGYKLWSKRSNKMIMKI